MNNKVLLFLVALLLLGGVFVLANNQNKMAPAVQDQAAMEAADEGVNEEAMEDEPEEAMDEIDDDAGEVKVSVTESGFEPKSVTVKVGTKVEWANTTEATANVSSAPHPTHETYPPLNLGDFKPGTTVELVFDEPGTYKYHDHNNASKFGTVVVE